MRRAAVVGGVLGLAVLAMGGLAQAGGPTSVLLASPESERAAGIYTTDPRYGQLERAVGMEFTAVPAADVPPSLGTGPGSNAVNVTWLAHDVSVWRVDRVHVLDGNEVWVNTILDSDFEDGAWHRAAQPTELALLLKGLLNAPVKLPVAAAPESAPKSAPETAPVASQAPTSSEPPASPWGWASVALIAGLGLGVAARPAVGAFRRAKTAGSRQQLIDA